MKKTLLSILMLSSYSHASGLLLQEAVTANAGTGGAGDGVYTKTATASWTNPATMSHMGESKTTINTLLLDLQMDYTDADPASDTGGYTGNASAETLMPAIGIFHVSQLNDQVHIGVNFGAVGGSTVEYGTEWDAGNYLDRAFMTALQLNPNISYAVSDKLSFGFGGQINYGLIEVSTSGFETEMGSDWTFGANAGVLYKEERWALGVSYRSKLVHEFDVAAKTLKEINPSLIDPLNPISTLPAGTPFSVGTELIVPAIIDLSGSYLVASDLELLTSVQFHQWSEFNDTPIYNNPLKRLEVIGVPQAIDRDWDDVWRFAIGADYQLNSDWALKAGFSYETSPQDDPTKQWVDLPVGEQYRYSVGATTFWNTTRIDMFYEYADLGDMDIERDSVGITGSFNGHIHFIGMNFTY